MPTPTKQIAQTYDGVTATEDLRSGYGTMPGGEFPTAIYVSVAGAFAWMLAAAWLAFGTTTGTDLDLAMITLLGTVFLGIPATLHHTATSRYRSAPMRMAEFLSSQIDTATGPMSARQVWLEVMLIPSALALAATLIGGVYMLGGWNP